MPVDRKTTDMEVRRTRGAEYEDSRFVDGLGNPVEFLLSVGNGNNSANAIKLLERVKFSGSSVLADRAYDA